MAIAFVQSRSVAGAGPLAYSSNVTAGNLLIVLAGSLDLAGGATFAVSDTQGNAYSSLALVDGNPAGGRAQIFFAIAKATGANSVTLTTASATPQLAIHEFSGVSSTLDASHSAAGAGTSQDSGPAATAFPSELLFGFSLHVMTGSGSVTVGAGWTQAENLINAPNIGGILTEFQTVSATGTFNATSTSSGGKGFSDQWLAEIATFVASAGGSTYQIGCRQHRTFVTPGMSI